MSVSYDAIQPNLGRLAPTLTVLGILAATVLALFPPMYAVGKRHDDERIFLANYRAPNEYEVFSNIPMNYAIESHEANDVVFVGDSALRCDIRTARFEQETGLKGYNLGNAGLIGMVGQIQIARNYLKHHPRPRLVVICISPNSLEPWGVEGRPPEERDVKSRFLWCFGPGTEDMRPHNSYLYHVQQGFKYTYGQLAGGFDRFANEPVPGRGVETYNTLHQSVTKERGFWAAPPRPAAAKAKRPAFPAHDQFTVLDSFKKDFLELIALFTDRDIPVLVRLTPCARATGEHSPNIEAWAADLEAKNPKVKFARPALLLYEPELYFDGDHLFVQGAEKFTKLVSAEVKQVLAGKQN